MGSGDKQGCYQAYTEATRSVILLAARRRRRRCEFFPCEVGWRTAAASATTPLSSEVKTADQMRPRRLGKISGEESAEVIRLKQALADAERRHDVAKGCVVLRKAFNRFLADAAGGTDAHFNAAERNDTNGLDHDTAGTSTAPRGITNGTRPVQPTMNPRLESLRIRAAESAQKFEDDASLKQVTLSRRVPSLSQLDLPKSQAKSQAKAAGSTMAADGPSGAQGGTPPVMRSGIRIIAVKMPVVAARRNQVMVA